MNKKSSRPKNNPSMWLQFEQEVARIFELFGYDEVIHNTKIEGGQCDVFAKSRKRNKANIVAECKYHENPSSKVNITDVQNFIHKVSNYRMSGKIDQGYLVTNTGFTADARGAINDQIGNYVCLLTFDELIQSLLDIGHYLQDYINDYDNGGEGDKYVELKLINTTILNQTILDCSLGDIINVEDTNQNYLVVPQSYIDIKDKDVPFLDFTSGSFSPTVKPISYFQKLQEYYLMQARADAVYNNHLVVCLHSAVCEVAVKINDDLLNITLKELPKDILEMTSKSIEVVVSTLLNLWQSFGGTYNLKIYDKSNFLKRIHQDIINKFKLKSESVSLTKIQAHPLISMFTSHIIEGLKIEPDVMELAIDKEKLYKWTYDFDNIIKHLKTNPASTKQLILLIEEEALAALKRHIIYDKVSTLVLVGDYGAGKTTILRRLMRKLAEDKLSKQDDPNCRIPLYISLKDYNKVPDIQSLIRLFLQNVVEVDNISIRTFKKLNEEGRFVLLLDAFDEMLTRVTRADRRRCFREISELVSKNSKIILTGRPAYFNDFKEFRENLYFLQKKFFENKIEYNNEYEVMCLQLLDEEQVEKLIEKASPTDFKNVLNIIVNRPNLMDLARRPVLANMIAQTGKELFKLENKEISTRIIYQIYTDRWVKREEDKGQFRLLCHPDEKSTFLRYLAMQMYISGSLTIHYSELDKSVSQYFDLNTIEEVDHFSNDIRTCSFLSRTNDGYYFFIHKSFMEYFVACEFERGEISPFVDKFSNDLTIEIIDLLDFDLLPKSVILIWNNRDKISTCIEYIKNKRSKSIKSQKYETAALLGDLQTEFDRFFQQPSSIFTMKSNPEINILYIFEIKIRSIFSKYEGSVNEITNIKNALNSHLGDFNFNF
ncbi:MAG TPA: NACHT domain-containing protein [Saprospiraceae bacterium]|nr:NACHT domain-containing protein [Saprospiraceae bacterium]